MIHELGHYAFGTLSGLTCKVSFSPLTGGACVCYGIMENVVWYFAIGGLLGATIAGLPLISSKVRAFKPLFICCVSISIVEFVSFIAETFDHASYISESYWTIALNSLFVVIYVSMILIYFRTKTTMRQT